MLSPMKQKVPRKVYNFTTSKIEWNFPLNSPQIVVNHCSYYMGARARNKRKYARAHTAHIFVRARAQRVQSAI